MKTLFKSLWVALAMLCMITSLNAQIEWNQAVGTTLPVNNITANMYRTGNVGIGTNDPLSTLSVNGGGDGRFGIYVTAPGQAPSATGLLADMPGISGYADWNRAVSGQIQSGRGYAIGVQGSSYRPTPSTDGRAYGVYAQAGNANINYGSYSTLRGNNRGTAVFGRVENVVIPGIPYPDIFNGQWAGYFIGRGYFSDDVGIGTDTPQAKLEVSGDVKIGGNNQENRLIFRGVDGDDQPWIGLHTVISEYLYAGTDNSELIIFKGDNNTDRIRYDATGGHIFQVGGTRVYNPAVGGTTAMTISNIGKVSIGANVNTPGNYKLYVKDGILTEQVKVALHNTSNWADYVFQADYDLKSLEEVEQFIQEEGHLHNTPSAEQLVEEGGIELKATAINQQEKIEELFLHVIEMNKRLKVLEKENEALRAALNK